MNYFLINYRFTEGTEDDWHQEIANFIRALKNNPELRGKISYSCFKSKKDNQYYHLAKTANEETTKLLGQQDFFKHYTEQTELISKGTVTVTPLELVATTDEKN